MNLHVSLYYKYYCVQLNYIKLVQDLFSIHRYLIVFAVLVWICHMWSKRERSGFSSNLCRRGWLLSWRKGRIYDESSTPLIWSNMEKPFLHPQSTTQNSQILAAGLAYLCKKKLWKIGGSIFPMGGESKHVLFYSSRDTMNTQYTKTWNHTGNWLSKLRMHAVDRSTTCPNYKMIQNASKPSDQYIQSTIRTGNIQKAKVDVSCVAAICWQCRSILRSCCLKLGHKSAGELHFAMLTFYVDDPKSPGIEVSAMGP